MRCRHVVTILACATALAATTGGTAAGETTTAPAEDVPWALVSTATARCLGIPIALPPLPGDLAAIKIPRDLDRLTTKNSGTCLAEAAQAPGNPIKALVDGLNALPPVTPARTAAQGPSPEMVSLAGRSNKPCIGLPEKVNVQSILALVNVGVQDIPVLASPQHQQCVKDAVDHQRQVGGDPLLDAIHRVYP